MLFWQDSWDGHPPILSSFPHLQPLCQVFSVAGWTNVAHFKTIKRCGLMDVASWKDPQDWPSRGSLESQAELENLLFSRLCSSSKDKDILAWGPCPKGKFSVAQGYA